MAVLWGPQLVQIHNDRYAELMAGNYPCDVGTPARHGWPPASTRHTPLYESVIERGESFTVDNQASFIECQGERQEVRFTLGFSPAYDELGAAAAIIVALASVGLTPPASGQWNNAASDDRLRIALEAAELGTWDLDLTTDTSAVRSLRHDQIFGYEEHQQVWGQEVATRHVLPEDRSIFTDAFAVAAATGVLSCVVRVRWPDGSIHWIAPRGRTYYDSDGRPVRMAGVVADVTERNRAHALRQSEERFRLMADAVPQIVWITDAQGRVEFFNQQWRKYTGLQFDPESAALVAAATVHPDDVALTMECFELARNNARTYQVEHRIRDAAGNYRWFLVRAEPYRDSVSGLVTRWFGASVDIHDRKLVEENLRQLTERQTFQILLADRIRPLTDPEAVTAAASELLGQQMQVGRAMYGEVDEPGERIAFQKGWTAGAMMSMDGVQLTMNDFGPSIVDQLRAGQVLAIEDVTTHPYSAPYADAYAANGIGAALAIPLMKQGRLQAILSMHNSTPRRWSHNDISMAKDMVDRTWSAVESARAQSKLRVERDRSQSVFDSMTEGFLLFNRDWKVLEINAEGLRIGQRTRAEVMGKSYWEVWPEALGTDAEQMYSRVMLSRTPETLEHVQTLNTGKALWIELRAYPAGKDDMAIVVRDISERKAAEIKLKEGDRRKDEFLAMLAHELRNPLAPIGAAAQLLQIAKLDEARVRSTSQIINRQVGHMTHLIDDLLDVSRVTRGLVELEREALDVGHIVRDAIEQVTPLVQARRHHLALHLPPDSAQVMGDKKRLVQVIANILNNAAKYTPEGGEISLKTEVRDAAIFIDVVDNGIGMPAELVTQAFELFAQAERSSDRSAGGLGLGLALVKNLVELHGGNVRCSSEGLGKGSTFTVCLPRIDALEPLEQDPHADKAVAPGAAPLRVLIVDDNVDAAAMLAMLLEAGGHKVSVEHEAGRGLERAKAEAPDVCLLDIGLPHMDGNQLAQLLRADPATAGSALIAVTGYGQESDRRRTLAAGFHHHLVKPVDTDQLASILSGINKG